MKFNSHAHAAQITGALGTTSDFDSKLDNAFCAKTRGS
jgi:hypothetical protein